MERRVLFLQFYGNELRNSVMESVGNVSIFRLDELILGSSKLCNTKKYIQFAQLTVHHRKKCVNFEGVKFDGAILPLFKCTMLKS